MKYLLLVPLLFIFSFAHAAISAGSNTTFTIPTLTMSGNANVTVAPTANNCVFVGVQDPNTTRFVSSVTVGGMSATPVQSTFTIAAMFNVDYYYVCGAPVGVDNVVVNLNNAAAAGAGIDIITYYGVNQTTPVDTSTGVTTASGGATSPLNFTVTTSYPGEVLTMATNWNVAVVAGAGTTGHTSSLVVFDSGVGLSQGSHSLQLTWVGTGKVGGIITALIPAPLKSIVNFQGGHTLINGGHTVIK